MHKPLQKTVFQKGFTLIELTVIIAVIITLAGFSIVGTQSYLSWKSGLEAGETLKAVYQAQRLYLADNPTQTVSTLTAQNVIDYLPDGYTSIPTITDLDDNSHAINYQVIPPLIGDPDPNQTTSDYDPSSSTNDGQWDVGKIGG